MRATGPSVVIIHHLKSLGIKLRVPKKTVSPEVQRKTTNGEIFGVPLQFLPLSKEGEIPQFVVDICQFLSCHLDTEGLFRKSGSVNRIKTLKAQLDSGDSSLTSAQPSDVAVLLKQFFRELPHPLLTPELQDPLCQIQQSLSEEERISATTLVTCLLPAIHGETLRYFCTFLQQVASRSIENKMDSGNLSVVLAPSLFSNGNLAEKLTLATEKQLQLQACAVQRLIDNAQDIGQLPSFIMEKLSAPCDLVEEESVTHNSEGPRRRRRRSMSGIVNEAINKLKSGLGPSSDRGDELELPPRNKTKRKASEDPGVGEQFVAKKRRSLRDGADGNLSSEESNDPNGVPALLQDGFGGVEVFSDVSLSPGNSLEQSSESPAIPATPDSSSRGQKARTKRRNSKRGNRAPSGQIHVSPTQLDRKEKVRNSLRLFQRTRTAKQATLEGKSMEPSGWNIMKRMVAEALEGPIFNGRDFRMNSFSLKGSQSGGKPSSSQHSLSPPLRSSPSLKSLTMNSEDLDEMHSGTHRRALRRSLSMPEKMGDCAKSDQDQEVTVQNNLTKSEEDRKDDNGLNDFEEKTSMVNNDQLPLVDCITSETSNAIGSQVSVTELGCLQATETLKIPNGHTSQYSSIRKLVLSFPWASGTTEMDPQLKPWEHLSTHTIKRKGAKRFGRSLSQDLGLKSNEDQYLLKRTDDHFTDGNTNTLRTLNGRNRQVFVSRKNITLSHCGSRSLDSACGSSVGTLPLHVESPVLDYFIKPDKDSLIFKNVVEDGGYSYRDSAKCPLVGTRLEPISDAADL
ncbi:rho GTPase-activating protein 11A-like [Eleutherodactylus coqui]|uniref:rho GTPase-activating protein 11A-like n=1 Tax=Eleutherodactylus coqui TaxID=57060 RepID=UPI0034626E73